MGHGSTIITIPQSHTGWCWGYQSSFPQELTDGEVIGMKCWGKTKQVKLMWAADPLGAQWEPAERGAWRGNLSGNKINWGH